MSSDKEKKDERPSKDQVKNPDSATPRNAPTHKKNKKRRPKTSTPPWGTPIIINRSEPRMARSPMGMAINILLSCVIIEEP